MQRFKKELLLNKLKAYNDLDWRARDLYCISYHALLPYSNNKLKFDEGQAPLRSMSHLCYFLGRARVAISFSVKLQARMYLSTVRELRVEYRRLNVCTFAKTWS